MATRTECDLLGVMEIPAEAPYGIQTHRALRNFPLAGGRRLGDYPVMVRALLAVKEAAAIANRNAVLLDARIAQALIEACAEAREAPLSDWFPIAALHGGGGTSANMNANEVLANLAERNLGGRFGEYRIVHPNEHANRNQSTNDVYPTACHLALLRQGPDLEAALESLARAYADKARELGSLKRLARTCLQDAVAVTFGDFLGGQAAFLRRSARRMAAALEPLRAVPMGGTIVGRTSDVPAAYLRRIVPALRKTADEPFLRRSANRFDAAQHLDDMVQVSSALDLCARGLVKLAKDLRLLASGPEAGLGEINLPAVQPGSSIMPGKINPVIPEYVIQAGFSVMGLHAACAAAVDHGELDLNVWESLVVVSILDAMQRLAAAARTLAAQCVAGLTADAGRNARHAAGLIPGLTELMKREGYVKASALCRRHAGDPGALRRAVRKAVNK